MNTRVSFRTLFGALALLSAPAALAQGALTPPGAPAPLFKTLDQVEARTPLGTPNQVTTSTIVISQPGSYVLVGPVTVASGDAIRINANNVTLDLNGFTLSSTGNDELIDGGTYAVRMAGSSPRPTNITVANGNIHGAFTVDDSGVGGGTGFDYGVAIPPGGAQSTNVQCRNLAVKGVRVRAIVANTATDCTCTHVGYNGIDADTVRGCVVTNVGADFYNAAIFAISVSNCTVGNSPGCAWGIKASSISNSFVNGSVETAIEGDSVTGCVGFGTNIGIAAYGAVSNSFGSISAATSGAGIFSDSGVVSFSTGYAVGGGTNAAIQAPVVIGCTAAGGAPIVSLQKHFSAP